jgi:hypothetical protein
MAASAIAFSPCVPSEERRSITRDPVIEPQGELSK